ncbi:MAG TPA: hypothetical protein VFW98_13965 [Gemmatimonadaceae bacterium]|nr:hypothetical protein [Gemmatimonadaceae bacterium]
MTGKLTLLLVLLGLAGTAAAQDSSHDWLLVPGCRVGPITTNSSEAELRTRFGPANVQPTTIYLDEGEQRPGTVVFPGDSANRLEILWRDTLARKDPAEVRLSGLRSHWRFKDGLTLGSSLRDLERVNGKAFRFNGWGSDAGGIIWGWDGGVLKSQLPLDAVRLYLAEPRWDLLNHHEQAELDEAREDTSSMPALQLTNPRVDFLRIFFLPSGCRAP